MGPKGHKGNHTSPLFPTESTLIYLMDNSTHLEEDARKISWCQHVSEEVRTTSCDHRVFFLSTWRRASEGG